MEKYIHMIKVIKNKQDLRDACYESFKDTSITMKQDDLITALSVYKENALNGASESLLKECMNTLHIPKKYINMII